MKKILFLIAFLPSFSFAAFKSDTLIVPSLTPGTSIYIGANELPINGGFGPQVTNGYIWLQGNDGQSGLSIVASTAPYNITDGGATNANGLYSEIKMSPAIFVFYLGQNGVQYGSLSLDGDGISLIANAVGAKIVLWDGTGGESVSLKAPDSVTSYTLTLPTDPPTEDGQCLTSTMDGVMSWGSCSGGAAAAANYALLEDDSYFLLEDDSKLLLQH